MYLPKKKNVKGEGIKYRDKMECLNLIKTKFSKVTISCMTAVSSFF